jgi:hypothetical protein
VRAAAEPVAGVALAIVTDAERMAVAASSVKKRRRVTLP